MNSSTVLNLGLIFHLVGLTLIAGSTFLDFATKGRLRDHTAAFPTVARTGIALLVASGIAMMAIMHGAYGSQIWMQIKIGLVVLVIINVLVLGKRKESMRLFHISQLLLFLTIITLSVFKFN